MSSGYFCCKSTNLRISSPPIVCCWHKIIYHLPWKHWYPPPPPFLHNTVDCICLWKLASFQIYFEIRWSSCRPFITRLPRDVKHSFSWRYHGPRYHGRLGIMADPVLSPIRYYGRSGIKADSKVAFVYTQKSAQWMTQISTSPYSQVSRYSRLYYNL